MYKNRIKLLLMNLNSIPQSQCTKGERDTVITSKKPVDFWTPINCLQYIEFTRYTYCFIEIYVLVPAHKHSWASAICSNNYINTGFPLIQGVKGVYIYEVILFCNLKSLKAAQDFFMPLAIAKLVKMWPRLRKGVL